VIVIAAVVTVAALAATVLVWRRWGRWGFLVRPAGVLLTEALLVLTVGLVVNRSQQFYPSWAALFATSDPGPASYHTSAGRLDARLAAQPSVRSFPWRPSGWTAWRLAAAPTVTVPADYLAHPSWRYSAVLVLGGRPWPLPPVAGPTVLVNVTTTAATTASTLAVAVPGSLGRDLRVTSHRWALVASAADGALARQVATVARGRFPALAFVGTSTPAHALVVHPVGPAAARPSHSATARPSHSATARPSHSATARPSHSAAARPSAGTPPAAPSSAATPHPGVLPTGIQTAYFPAARGKPAATDLAGPLRAALQWAAAQTPPPLAASAPEPTYLPPAPKRPHHAKPKPKAVNHGPRQPRP
jgi:hypothetical protein